MPKDKFFFNDLKIDTKNLNCEVQLNKDVLINAIKNHFETYQK